MTDDAHRSLRDLSQQRWRGDEPDAGLTWGVMMAGDAFAGFLLTHAAPDETSTIVEIGPGYGRILWALLERGTRFRRYVGLELSSTRVARLRDRFRDRRIEFREADILGDPGLDGSADLVFASAVFEHLYPDFGPALASIARFTRPGGSLVLDFIRADETIAQAAAWFDQETYMRIYSRAELETLLGENGFVLDVAGKTSLGPDITGREITRTVIRATKKPGQNPDINPGVVIPPVPLKVAVPTAATSAPPSFDSWVQRVSPPSDPHARMPPFASAFRTRFGGLWTDLDRADAILAGKVAIGALTPEEGDLVAAWRRDGFVIIRGAVDGAAIDAALADLERAFAGTLRRKISYWDARGHHTDEACWALAREIDAKLLDLHDLSDAIQAIQFAVPISRFLKILFERPALAFQSLGFAYGSRQPLHQDTAFVRVSSPMEFVASWIALEDVAPGSGELEYYPGSHALEPHLFGGQFLWAQPGDEELARLPDGLRARAEQAGLARQTFLPRRGDVLVWSAGLMHGGSPVVEPTRTRKSLVTHYCPADLQPMYAYKGGRSKRRSRAGHYVMAERWY